MNCWPEPFEPSQFERAYVRWTQAKAKAAVLNCESQENDADHKRLEKELEAVSDAEGDAVWEMIRCPIKSIMDAYCTRGAYELAKEDWADKRHHLILARLLAD